MIDIERGGLSVHRRRRAQRVGEFKQTDRAVGAGDGEAPVGEFDVAFGGFQFVGRGRLALGDHQIAGFDDRGTARHDRARAAGAAAAVHDIAVVLHQADAVERDTKFCSKHLRERRRMALAVIERAGGQKHGAVRFEIDLAEFGEAGRHFEITADRDAAQLAALARLALALGEAGVVGQFQRLVEHGGEVAGIVGHAVGGGERNLRRLDQVAAAQGQAVDAHLGGGAIQQALHEVIGFGAACAAIGAHERGVGHHALDVHFDQRRAIDTGDVLGDVERQRQRPDAGDIGAEVAKARHANAEDDAPGIQRQFGAHVLRAAVIVAEKAH